MTWISVRRISVRQSIKVFLGSGSVKPASVAVKTKGGMLWMHRQAFWVNITVKSIMIRYGNDILIQPQLHISMHYYCLSEILLKYDFCPRNYL